MRQVDRPTDRQTTRIPFYGPLLVADSQLFLLLSFFPALLAIACPACIRFPFRMIHHYSQLFIANAVGNSSARGLRVLCIALHSSMERINIRCMFKCSCLEYALHTVHGGSRATRVLSLNALSRSLALLLLAHGLPTRQR